jgi:hypothetical protein
MLLRLMRYVLTTKFKASAKKYPELKQLMKLRDFTIAIITKDHKSGMHFTFNDGEVTSGSGDHQGADAKLIWENSLTAFKVLASQNNYKFALALFADTLRTEGNVNLIVLFQDIAFKAMSPAR